MSWIDWVVVTAFVGSNAVWLWLRAKRPAAAAMVEQVRERVVAAGAEVVSPEGVKLMAYEALYQLYKSSPLGSYQRSVAKTELLERNEERDRELIARLGDQAVAAISPEKRQELWTKLQGAVNS